MILDREFDKPVLLMSQCLELDSCRHDGSVIKTPGIRQFHDHFRLVSLCPEQWIGLGVPRESIRFVGKDQPKLVQPSSENNTDLTIPMTELFEQLKDSLSDLDGAIMKSRSPSCGISGIKRYHHQKGSGFHFTGSGLFPEFLKNNFPYLPIEEEGRLRNMRIRHHFLTRVYIFREFKVLCTRPSKKALYDFHARHKYVLLIYKQESMRKMGSLLARMNDLEDTLREYETLLYDSFDRMPSLRAHRNTLEHALGYFKKDLNDEEKRHFLNLVDLTSQEQLSLNIPMEIMRSWILRFQEKYLANQSYFNPFPQGVLGSEDSGRSPR